MGVTQLLNKKHRWLVTGAAGFIGSNLCEFLLQNGQIVRGLDNYSTGKRAHIKDLQSGMDPDQRRCFEFVEGDIRDYESCLSAVAGVDIVLHQAALGSVPRSIKSPQDSHAANVDGFVNMMRACLEKHARRLVFASSSSVYGNDPNLPKIEDRVGEPLSPYAATKTINEIYARVFERTYGLSFIGLRYFNVFGPRQDPDGAYAAVIPKWIGAMCRGEEVVIHGDGETSRDFCFIANTVQANVLAGLSDHPESSGQLYNIAVGEQTSLNQLFRIIRDEYNDLSGLAYELEPRYEDFRPGDVRHSLADISKASDLIGYQPTHGIREGLRLTVEWFLKNQVGNT
jgi:UDP-N-acetylglucosamine 4-epimerase